MNDSDDIANLFKQFGGEADQYREIGRSNDVKLAKERWPLLSSVEATRPADAPPVHHKDGLAQPPVPNAGLSALRSAPIAPQAPAAFQTQPGALRQEPILNPDSVPLSPPRSEPSLSASAVETPVTPVATEAAPAKTGPAAEFIPPRSRPSTKFAHRTPTAASSALAPSLPEPAPAPVAAVPVAAAPVVSAPAPAPAPTPAPAAPAQAAPAVRAETPASGSDLQSVFARLAQPQRTVGASGQADKNSTLLQRLSRL